MYNLNPYLFNLMQAGFNSWPLYTLILSFGQLLGFSVFQLVLLDSDEENPSMNYFITGSVYILGTLFFWSLYRKFPSIVVLTTPFVLYTLSFILLLLRSSIPGLSLQIRFIMDRVALWLYSFTSASGAFYFVLNFG